jgi:hypothetical protein
LALGFPSALFAVGECGAQFLKMGVGARACAMGEAFAAVADDASAIYWNPAGLKQLTRVEVMAMQNFWLLDMSYQYVGLAVPTPVGAFGLAGAYSSSGTIPRYEEFRKVGEYSAYDAAGTVSYANRVAKFGPAELAAGLGLKYIQQKIDTYAASGFAGDMGVHFRVSVLRLGLVLQNLGPGLKFIDQSDPLPLNLKAGLGAKLGPVTVAADMNKPRDNELIWGAGLDVTPIEYLSLRAGYNTARSWSAGLGVTWKVVSVDYAFVPYKEIDATHRISARVRF